MMYKSIQQLTMGSKMKYHASRKPELGLWKGGTTIGRAEPGLQNEIQEEDKNWQRKI